MQYGSRITAYLRASRALYETGGIGLDEMRARAARAGFLLDRDRYLRTGPPRGTARDAEALACLARLSDAVASGLTVTAIDVGSGEALGVEEIGICTLSVGGSTTLTLFDVRAPHRDPAGAPGPRQRTPLFGETRAMGRAEILEAARDAYAAADVAIFHSASADLHRLGLEPDPAKVIDTVACSRLWHPQSPSLADLCRRYGIDASGAHHSGNDARYALDAALAMARDPSLPKVAERHRLRVRRDQARRALLMHPTRLDGREALLAEWEAANNASMRFRTGPMGPVFCAPARGRRPAFLAA